MPGQLTDDVTQFLAEAIAIQSFVTLVEATPTPTLDLITKQIAAARADHTASGKTDEKVFADLDKAADLMTRLTAHIAQGKAAAANWRGTVLPTVHDFGSGMESLNATFQVLTPTVDSLLTKTTWAEGEVAAGYQQVHDLLALLGTTLDNRVADLDTLTSELQSLADTLRTLSTTYATDDTDLGSLLNDDDGLLAEIRSAISDANSSITKDIVGIALGSLAIGIGIGLIIGGVVAIVGTAGGGAVPGGIAIGAGVLCIIAGAITDGVLGPQLAALRATLANLTEDLQIISALKVFFTGFGPHLAALATAAQSAGAKAGRLKQQYADIKVDLDKLETPIAEAVSALGAGLPATPEALKAMLNTVKGDVAAMAHDLAVAVVESNRLQNVLDGVTSNLVVDPTPPVPASVR